MTLGWGLLRTSHCFSVGRPRPLFGRIAPGCIRGWGGASCSSPSHLHTVSSVVIPGPLGSRIFIHYCPCHKALAYNGPLAWLGILYQC